MNDVIIIVFCILIVLFCGGYFLFLLVNNLYEWYIETFTVDPDPDNPEQPQKSQWMEFWESLKPSISGIINQSKSVTEMAIRTIVKISKDYRKQSYKTTSTDRLNERSEEIMRKYRTPPRYSAGRLPKQHPREAPVMEHMYPEDDVWDSSKLSKRVNDLEKRINDRINRIGTDTSSLSGTRHIPKGSVWDARYRHKDYWDAKKSKGTGNTGPK